MNKEVLKFIIKVLIYALGLIGSALGITALTSCSSSRVETMVFVVDQNQYDKFVHYISSEYDFYSIINCGDLYSRSPKYVHKDFTRL